MSVRFVDRFAIAGRHMRAQAERGMRSVGAEAIAYCRSITPVDTGRLRDSETFVVSGTGPLIRITLGSDVPYAIHIEYGTTRGVPAYAMFRRTLDAFASRFAASVAAGMGA